MSNPIVPPIAARQIVAAEYVTLRCLYCWAGVELIEEPGGDLAWQCVNPRCGHAVMAGCGLEEVALKVVPAE